MKPFKTIDEQIAILKSRNMTIEQDYLAAKVLTYENYYYVINGYKEPFIASTKPQDSYKSGTNFSEILGLYTFDRRLRELLLIELLRIEHAIKAHIILTFSKNHGHDHTSYLRPESFNSTDFTNFKRVNGLIFDLLKLLDKQQYRHGAISHYMKKYGYVPLWVFSKVMTFGKINSFYACMLSNEKDEVANAFGLNAKTFKALIDLLADFRNKCAHGERIYCYSKDKHFSRPIPNLLFHSKLNIPKNNKGYKYGTQDILALLIAMKYFMHTDRYHSLIGHIDYALHDKLSKRLSTIPISDIENIMGLNGDWLKLKTL